MQIVGPRRGMLLTDEQRDNACALLRDQYGDGRMTLEDYSARIDRVLAARDTKQVSLAFNGLEAPAWLAPRPELPQLVPSWVTAVSGLGVALGAAELAAFVAFTILDPKNRLGGIEVDALVAVAAGLQSVAWISLARRREWAPVFALVTSVLLTIVTFGLGIVVAVPVWWGVLRRNRAR